MDGACSTRKMTQETSVLTGTTQRNIPEDTILHAGNLLVGKPKGSRPLGIPERRWVIGIKTVLIELGCDSEDWICLA
jgi:hypothetical protein